MERTWRWVRRCPSQQSFYSFVAQLLFVLAFLQGCAESASRVQNSKPVFNEITPSPEFSINTDGWRPIVPPSTSPPPKTEEEMRAVVDNQPPKHPKQRVTPNRFPSESQPVTLEGLAPPPIDVIADSEKSGDNEAQLRLRRQKKRPPFKTVDPPVLISSGSETLSFRVNSESPFVRHYADAPDSQFRHRPIETNSGAVYRAVHAPLQGTPFRMSDPAPSQEMLPPTAPSRQFPLPVESQHFRLRPQQQPLQGSHIIFHGQLPIQQQQQQRFPSVARPSDPLPGSILRPHADRTPLTDSSAFRTGGGQFHYRPAPVQWHNPLNEGRPSYSVTNTPLVDDHPWPSSNHHNGDRRPEISAVTVFPHHGGSQSIRGSNEGKPQKDASQVTATTVIIPDVPKNPFVSAQKAKVKPQREQNRPQFHVSSTVEQVGADSIGQTHKQRINPSLRDTSLDSRPSKTPSVEVGLHISDTNKPLRENNDGKRFEHHGMENFGSEENLRPRDKKRPETMSSDMNREERPRLPGSSKFRQNTNYRKRPEEPSMNVNAEPTNQFSPVSTPTLDKVIPSNQGANTQRGQGFRVRKRRPKPSGQRQETQSNKPLRTQEVNQYQQEVYQQKDHPQPQQEVFQQQFQHQQVHQQHVTQPQKETHQEQIFHPQQDVNPEHETHQLEDPNKQQVIHHQSQENYQPQQEEVTQQQEVQQPKVVSQRKRLRRPTRIRKPIKESVIEPSIPKEENYLLPTGQADTIADEQTQKHKFRESRPRPILRTRRPRPETSSPLPIQNIATAPDDTSFIKEDLPYERPKKVRVRPAIRYENKENYNGRDNGQLHSSIVPEPTSSYVEQTHEVDAPGKTQNFKVNEPLFEEENGKEFIESLPVPVTDDGYLVHESNMDAIDVTTKHPELAADIAEIEEQKINNPDYSIFPTNSDLPETSTSSTTSEAPVIVTTESQTTTVAPTSSAYGIRNRLRAGSRPRFSVKDYRERLNRLSQLSGRGRDSTDSSAEADDTPSTGSGVGPSAPSRERWYPGRRQQQTLQEQQQLQHQRLQANRNDGESQGEKSKTESRDRYRPRAPALRPRPSASESKKSEETASNANGKNDEIYTTTTSKYRSRFGGRYSTTTSGNTNTETTTTESPTSRRRGILTTYGMRRPYPLRLRSGTTTSTESADVQSATETTTPMTASNEITTTMNPTTTEPTTTTTTSTTAPVTTTTSTTTTTTTTEIIVPKVVENEVTERNSEDRVISKDANGMATEVKEVMELKESMNLKDSMLRQDELIKAGEEAPMEESEEEESEEAEEDSFNPAQRVSDLTLWATTGNSGGLKTDGSKDKGLVTFSAVPYPSSAFSSRLVTMATEDPVLPLEAFFFRPSPNSNRSGKE